jgi:hypothetical protein
VWLVVAQALAQSAWEEDSPDLNPLIGYHLHFCDKTLKKLFLSVAVACWW